MKVCFLLQDLALSGGVGVVVEHAHHLAQEHGFDVTLVVLEHEHGRWAYSRLDGVHVAAIDDVADQSFDVAVATWWRTAYRLFDVRAERYAYFVQSLEDRFYPDSEVDRLQAAVTHDLPVAFITEAQWIADTITELRPEAPCYYVRNGVAKDVFPADVDISTRPVGPLRVLIEGHPDLWFKAVDEAIAGASLMREPSEVTLVTPSGDGAGGDASVHRTVGPLSHEEMAEAYRRSDVVLKLSRVEGMFGPPLEGFHMGATCVVSPVTGHEEFVVHGWNGVVVDWDDPHGVGRWLDVLATDRRLLHHLRSNALETARAWPSWSQSSRFMAAALEAIRSGPAPAPANGAARMIGDVLASSEKLRNDAIMLEHLVHAANAEAEREIAHLKQTRAYEMGVFLRERVWKHPTIRKLTWPLRIARRLARRL